MQADFHWPTANASNIDYSAGVVQMAAEVRIPMVNGVNMQIKWGALSALRQGHCSSHNTTRRESAI